MQQIKTPLGKILMTPRGSYDPLVMYERLDVITHLGGSWLVTTAFTNIEPSKDNPNVQLIAEKGDSIVSLTVGSTTTADPGTAVSVTNVGTTSEAILNFSIPKGEKGDKGKDGETEINKTSIEAVLTGDLTSHTHDVRYYTQPQVDAKIAASASSNDYTTAEKKKLAGIEAGAEVNKTIYISSEILNLTGSSTREEILEIFGSLEEFFKMLAKILKGYAVVLLGPKYMVNMGMQTVCPVYKSNAMYDDHNSTLMISTIDNEVTRNVHVSYYRYNDTFVINNNYAEFVYSPENYDDNKLRGIKNNRWTEIVDGVPAHNSNAEAHADIRGAVTAELNLKADKTSTYTKAQIDAKIDEAAASIYNFRGNVESVDLLPMTDNGVGDVYNCLSDDANYAWTGEEWDSLGGIATLATDTDDGLLANEDFVKLQTVEEYAQPNTIENVSVDGVTLPISNKKVNIVLPAVADEVHIGANAPTGTETVWIDTDDTTFDQTIVTEAPVNGKLYGRKDKRWGVVPTAYDDASAAGYTKTKESFDLSLSNIDVPKTYAVSSAVRGLSSTSTSEQISEAIGGVAGFTSLSEAIGANMPIAIATISGDTELRWCIRTINGNSIRLEYLDAIDDDMVRRTIIITKLANDTFIAFHNVTSVNGSQMYQVHRSILSLTNESSSPEIADIINGRGETENLMTAIFNKKILAIRNDPQKFNITSATYESDGDLRTTISYASGNDVTTVTMWKVSDVDGWKCTVVTTPFLIKPEGKDFSTNDFTNEYKDKVDAAISGAGITKELIETALTGDVSTHTHNLYVEKVKGLALSTNDFDNDYKNKVDASLITADVNKTLIERVLTGNITSHTHSAYVTQALYNADLSGVNQSIQVAQTSADVAGTQAQNAETKAFQNEAAIEAITTDVTTMGSTVTGIRAELTNTTAKTTTLDTSLTALQTTTTGLNNSIGTLEGQMRNLRDDVRDITSYEPRLVSGSVLNLTGASSSDTIGVAVGGDDGWTALIAAIRNNAPILINVGTKTATNAQSLIPSETSIIVNGNDEQVSIKAWIGDRMHFVTITRLTTTGAFSASGSANRVVIEVAGKSLSTNDFTDEYKTKVDKSLRLNEIVTVSSLSAMPMSDYNLKYTYTSTSVVGISFTGTPVEGTEFAISIQNNNGSTIVQPLPNSSYWQVPAASVEIPAGKVVEIFIKCVHAKYIVRT